MNEEKSGCCPLYHLPSHSVYYTFNSLSCAFLVSLLECTVFLEGITFLQTTGKTKALQNNVECYLLSSNASSYIQNCFILQVIIVQQKAI